MQTSGLFPELLGIFLDNCGTWRTQGGSKPSAERAAQWSGDCGPESGASNANGGVQPTIGTGIAHRRSPPCLSTECAATEALTLLGAGGSRCKAREQREWLRYSTAYILNRMV
jgi:hypothetical protein